MHVPDEFARAGAKYRTMCRPEDPGDPSTQTCRTVEIEVATLTLEGLGTILAVKSNEMSIEVFETIPGFKRNPNYRKE